MIVIFALVRDSQYARAGPAMPPPTTRTFKGAISYVVDRRIDESVKYVVEQGENKCKTQREK